MDCWPFLKLFFGADENDEILFFRSLLPNIKIDEPTRNIFIKNHFEEEEKPKFVRSTCSCVSRGERKISLIKYSLEEIGFCSNNRWILLLLIHYLIYKLNAAPS